MPVSSIIQETIQPGIQWVYAHHELAVFLWIFSLVSFFGSLLIIPVIVIGIPEDYFLFDRIHLKEFRKQHPVVRLFSVVFKNILGLVFIVTGVFMLFLPGQGVITMLIGLTLVSFPKKRALEKKLIQLESVHKAINWIRLKAGKPPVVVPAEKLPGGKAGKSD